MIGTWKSIKKKSKENNSHIIVSCYNLNFKAWSDYFNLDARVYDFINHDTKELNINSVSNILPISVIADINAIHIPFIEDKIWE